MKYGAYTNISCEYSLLMAIATCTYTTILTNNMHSIGVQNQQHYEKSRDSIHTFLNKPTTV